MKTPEEIKKGLERGFCHECPYDINELETVEECLRRVLKDALAYIIQLEQRIAQEERERDDLSLKNLFLETSLESVMEEYTAVKRERDAAVKELSNSCTTCKFIGLEFDDSPCDRCFQRDGKHPWSPMVRTRFEWRGVTEENP